MNKNLLFPLLLTLCISIFSSCKDQDGVLDLARTNCPFTESDRNNDGAIDEWEQGVMSDCMDAQFLTTEELQNHLPGEWVLVGFGHGWFHGTPQPCSKITITESELILEFKNKYLDTTTVHSWQITEGTARPFLKISPAPPEHMFFSSICEDYMFGDGTPFDGNMFLYQKLK